MVEEERNHGARSAFFIDSRKAGGAVMRASPKSPLAVRRVASKSVFGRVPNGIELGLQIATGLLITFAMGLVLLAAEVRFGARVERPNNPNAGDIQTARSTPGSQ
jgi:hypothetical protein